MAAGKAKRLKRKEIPLYPLHPSYYVNDPGDEPFRVVKEGSNTMPGACSGRQAIFPDENEPKLGTIRTGTDDNDYYNDPLLKIPGMHFIALPRGEGWHWVEIRKVMEVYPVIPARAE